MQVDLPEPADDRTVSASVDIQPASEPGSTIKHDEQTNIEDTEPAHARPRTRVRHVSPRSLSEIKSSYELVSVVYGAVQAHQQLHERAGVLHGDINPNTILILDWPSESGSPCASESESPGARASESPSVAAPDSQSQSASQSQPGGPAPEPDPDPERSASSSRHGRAGEGEGESEGEGGGEGRTEGALVDFDVPYSAAAWRHPRPGPYRWENHSRLRMRRYGFY
ncbi:hypothetical protein K466DRAFT_617041 [Polyporus arcularius HHB13444]|uniref:Fungal-type protein kinase domain-containing protein n=1 Tax=Polyporus arcularius HHB13444 TaxID=1314778 RepID=A0A5C3PCD4_9APHY|nr:hypothetical protein K466DRAFT_617041 [Polyporus arcularius HHB13444]